MWVVLENRGRTQGWDGGLDPRQRYRVRTVLVGSPVSGLAPPPWWSKDSIVLTGGMLESAGLTVPGMHPEHAVLLHVTAEGDG